MSWEDLPERMRRARTDWAVSVSKTGVTLWMPDGHPLGLSTHVLTQQGKGEHSGWIRLVPAAAGRKINLVDKSKKANSPRFIKYATLPGAPGDLKLTVLTARPDGSSGAWIVKLPWEAKKAGYSMTHPVRAVT